ncbi:hypothetical protein AB0M79_29925, partial [Polymorphospora sp. NPDC051019]
MTTILDYLGGVVLPDTPTPDTSVVGSAAGPAARLAGFRRDFYQCLPRRADALFELTDALLCSGGPVTSLVDLS